MCINQKLAGSPARENLALSDLQKVIKKLEALNSGQIKKRVLDEVIDDLKVLTEIRVMNDNDGHDRKKNSYGILVNEIAHNLINILHPILGYTSLLQQQPDCNPRILQYIKIIYSETNKARDRVQQIISLAKESENTIEDDLPTE